MQAPRIPSSERLSEKCKLKQSTARSHGSPDEEENLREFNMKKKEVYDNQEQEQIFLFSRVACKIFRI